MNTPRHCSNCGQEAPGRYCPTCGQSQREFRLPITRFLAEFASEALAFDSRLATTLKPLFVKPGHVAAEYVAGRRARFVPPVRLYVFASFAMFLAMALNGTTGQVTRSGSADSTGADSTSGGFRVTVSGEEVFRSGAVAEDGDSTVAAEGAEEPSAAGGFLSELGSRLSRGIDRAADDTGAFRSLFLSRMAQAMFLLLPVFALLLKIVYPSRLYVEHLVYSVYFHAFVFMVVAVINVPAVLGFTTVTETAGLVQLGFPVYLFLGMRRMYGESRRRTVLKFAGLSAAYFVTLMVVLLAVLTITLIMV